MTNIRMIFKIWAGNIYRGELHIIGFNHIFIDAFGSFRPAEVIKQYKKLKLVRTS